MRCGSDEIFEEFGRIIGGPISFLKLSREFFELYEKQCFVVPLSALAVVTGRLEFRQSGTTELLLEILLILFSIIHFIPRSHSLWQLYELPFCLF